MLGKAFGSRDQRLSVLLYIGREIKPHKISACSVGITLLSVFSVFLEGLEHICAHISRNLHMHSCFNSKAKAQRAA